MDRITIFDTSVCSENLGDEIIMDCVKNELMKCLPKTSFLRVPTHEKISEISYIRMKKSSLGIVGGTNLLAANMRYPINQWNIHLWNAMHLKNVILMGVGSQNYNNKVNFYTKMVYKKALSSKYLHSVRDNHTEKLMIKMGFNNVINTGCPTLWSLNKELCESIPRHKAKDVVCTFTDYNRDIKRDKYLSKILFENYRNVYCWIQGSEDYEYVKSISNKFKIIDPHLEEYDKILESDLELDYIGTRLHAGIRAMQKRRRSIIISIDNRAREMGKDYNLNVIEREDIENLEEYLLSEFKTDIKLNLDNIKKWKEQFKK
ncbi:polysaccharide pyruvyl transferase family protein [Clostridium perfringens]|uniref:Polysaccharide pyruvyl transferase family protein n=2 Tax=Clostridium perfringens TaxID=1502 RepID=A0AAE8FPK6_CLOPF|nr:polysaccharide pyruvyl transferase family protein [Clostridium perfringens]EIL8447475.1 polysaccharide pyruvyl transferase family protein [Clostridium perfringens]EIL8448390.1 polysaccharide pyruvyl transferase family protein [Clostridium perfringens]MBI6011089.1 polysaccharide pyruvyl transferase family protein [Clostridium perfringens]MBI6071846.1 polysaccharide pyruvyl transferase family protein [Clostridium perfringens]MDB2041361.1 polysaccharide pyruvyl transferase family protein [Clos